MALTQEQVDWWFSQNPDATAEDVAAAVKSIGGLEANAGLAGMLANRFSIAEPDVTNYYNTYVGATTPTTSTTNTDAQTFTDNIINTPTTETDLFKTIGDGQPPITQTTIYEPKLVDLGNGTFRTPGGNIIDSNGYPVTTTTPPADNITSTGYTKPSSGLTGVANQKVIEGDDIETQIAQLPQEYASWQASVVPGYSDFIRKSDGAILQRTQNNTFSDLDLLKIGLSFIPGAGPILAAINVADAARTGNWTQAAIGATGLIPGMQNVNTALRVGQAIDQNNPFGAITALAGNTDAQNLLGLGNVNVGGFTAKDAMAGANLIQAAGNNNYAGILTNLGVLTGSADTTLAGRALAIYTRLQNGDTRALTDAINLSNSISGSTAGDTTGSTTGANITTLSDEDLAELQPGELNAYQTGGVQGLADFRRDMRLLTGLTTSGRTGDDTGGGDTTSFINSLGTLDQLDTNRTADEYADFLASIGITNTTQLADSGLSNQDILDLINAGTDTVTVTGGTGNDTVTGGGGNDNLETVTVVDKKCPPGQVYDEDLKKCVPIETITIVDKKCPPGQVYDEDLKKCVPIVDDSCPTGYERDEITGKCIPVVTIVDKKCPPGQVYDEDLKQCVLIPDDSCPEGFERDEATGKCIPVVTVVDKTCPTGQVYDEDLKKCVPITTDECETGYEKVNGVCVPVCKEGYSRDEATGQCIPVVTIIDKKCPTGQVYDEELKKCVPIETDECAVGFHKDATGLCVPDDDEECKDGYEKVNGTCVPVCKEGYIRNLESGVCEKVEKECPVGQVRNAEGKCVPIPKECQPGFERVNGVCVPICQPGYVRIDGVCKKIPTEVITTMPVSGIADSGEKTDPIYAGGMDSFNLLATLQELLAEEPPKKDDKKSKDKTKMATGGHLDDLLAEQMTVDDLLKLLR